MLWDTSSPPRILRRMTKFIALLRAVNVGGTGKIPMADLKAMCTDAGFERIETYIASGNVLFDCKRAATAVKAELESRLLAYAGRPISVFVRTTKEMQEILRGNPFPKAEPARVHVFFLEAKPHRDAATNVLRLRDEEIRVGKRELYVHYPSGMGNSKLTIAAVKYGTARNMNTVAKLVEISA